MAENVHPRLKAYLDPIVDRFECPGFIQDDPVSIPHGFDDPADQEIIGLFAALLAWGRRDTMLRKLEELCERMDYRPAAFIRDVNPESGRHALEGFVHRTFNDVDAVSLCLSLKSVIREFGSLESLFIRDGDKGLAPAIERFSSTLLDRMPGRPRRMRRHVARPSTGSACKRLVMYLRWMVRPGPVDLGIWTGFPRERLALPLDVHSGRQARAVGLLERASNDWRAVEELTAGCRMLDPRDPARYDFAFFGTGSAGETLLSPG